MDEIGSLGPIIKRTGRERKFSTIPEENLFEEIMALNFPNLEKETDI